MSKICFRVVVTLVFVALPVSLSAQLCENLSTPMPTGLETVFAELGGVQLVSRELTKPCAGFDAAIIEARAMDPSASMVVLTNLEFTGAHQVWSSLDLAGTPFETPGGALHGSSWSQLDSHFLFTPEMIAGGVYSFSETNDRSTSSELPFGPLTTTAIA